MRGATSSACWPAACRTGCEVATMASIIRLNLDRHREVQTLLPWYVTDQLDAADLARVEAHLADCAECQAELSLERHLDAGVASLPLGVEQDWAEFRRRLRAASTRRSRT